MPEFVVVDLKSVWLPTRRFRITVVLCQGKLVELVVKLVILKTDWRDPVGVSLEGVGLVVVGQVCFEVVEVHLDVELRATVLLLVRLGGIGRKTYHFIIIIIK